MKINDEALFWIIVDYHIAKGNDFKEKMADAMKKDFATYLETYKIFEKYTDKYPLWQFGSEINCIEPKLFID